MKNRSLEDITRSNVEAIAKLESAATEARTTAERLADAAARLIGSWSFLAIQSTLLLVWVGLGVYGWSGHWDPYPFVLLNLLLSFQAAFATPLILMSENRQARLTQRRNHLDLQINLLSEQENTEQLRLLHLLCRQAGIEVAPKVHAFLESASPHAIVEQLIEGV